MLLDTLSLDRGSAESLSSQLARAIRNAIVSGEIKGATRLPSSRELAAAHGIGRKTVVEAYEILVSEQFAETRSGSGTFVIDRLAAHAPTRLQTSSSVALSKRGQLLADLGRPAVPMSRLGVLTPGMPALDLFPRETWVRSLARANRVKRAGAIEDDPAGWRPLREAIAAHIGPARGIACDAEQIMVLDGARAAVDLVAKLLTDAGDAIWLEDPGFPEARFVFRQLGLKVAPIAIDQHGLKVADGMVSAPDARLAYVTPSHQYPTGTAMSAARRMDLLSWAQSNGAWIIEDDYDGEFRHRGAPLATLASIDQSGRVIHLGTFSKSMFPALRLAYLVLPPELIDSFRAARHGIAGHAGVTAQKALADFITTGQFATHIKSMRVAYGERQSALLDVVSRHLDGVMSTRAHDTGLHTVGQFSATIDDLAVVTKLRANGVGANALSGYAASASNAVSGLVMGYAGWPQAQLDRAVATIAKTLG